MKGQRRLRRLVPDAALIRRRAEGESVRSIALDYGVAHTTLLDYFARPEVAREIKDVERQLRIEQRAVKDRHAAERRLEREVRKKAKEQVARERKEARHATAAVREIASRRSRSRSRYAAWLDEQDACQPLTRADLRSQDDDIADAVVTEGGGIQDVIEATDSRTLDNVTSLIDPAILERAYDNDLLRAAAASPLT